MKANTAISAKPRRKRLIVRAMGVAAVAGALAWLAPTGGSPETRDVAVAPVADEAPGYAVEDFNYPNADKILAEQGITLKRGDGHITLVDCSSGTGFIEVWARRQDNKKICFQVTGKSGWLTLELPAVHSIKGNDYTTEVDMTVEGEEKSFAINKNAWTSVGESVDEQGREHMLVEIRSAM